MGSKNHHRNSSLLLGSIPRVGNKDLKYFDTDQYNGQLSLTEFGVTMPAHLIEVVSKGSGISRNAGVSGRIASKIFPKKLVVRGRIGFPRFDLAAVGKMAAGRTGGRVIVFVDKQSNQALADEDELLTGSDIDNFSARLINYANTKRFQILYDKHITIPAQESIIDTSSSETFAQQSFVQLDCEVDLQGHTVLYSDDVAGASGNVMTNNIYLLFCPDHIDAALVGTEDDGYWAFQVNTRLYYTG